MNSDVIKKFFTLFIRPVIKDQIIAFIFLVICTVASIIFPYFLKLIIDDALAKKNLNLLIIYSVGMIITAFIMILFKNLQCMKFVKIGQKIIFNIKQLTLDNLMTYSYNFYSKKTTGEIVSVLEQDVDAIEDLATTVISDILVNLFTSIGLFIILFSMNFEIAVVSLVASLVFAFIQNKLGVAIRNRITDLRERIADLNSVTFEIVSSISFIQILNCVDSFKNSYKNKQRKCINSNIKFWKTRNYLTATGGAFSSLGILLVLIIGGMRILKNEMTVGTLFALTIYIQRVYGPVINLSEAYITVQKSKAILKRIFNLMEREDIIEDGNLVFDKPLNGEIDFKNVCFKYGTKPILEDVNIYIDAGEIVGIVGENGSGKTSITRILTRLCKIQSGKILIDSRDINEYKLDYFRNQIGYMTQKVFIFKGTVRDNLILGNQDIDDEKLCEILEAVRLKEDIDNMPNGLDTILEEKGANLSGGQAQKISLARIILKNPSIVILDEPTASIDLETERFLSLNLKELLKNKTILIISHREELLKQCSRVFKLEDCEIVENKVGIA